MRSPLILVVLITRIASTVGNPTVLDPLLVNLIDVTYQRALNEEDLTPEIYSIQYLIDEVYNAASRPKIIMIEQFTGTNGETVAEELRSLENLAIKLRPPRHLNGPIEQLRAIVQFQSKNFPQGQLSPTIDERRARINRGIVTLIKLVEDAGITVSREHCFGFVDGVTMNEFDGTLLGARIFVNQVNKLGIALELYPGVIGTIREACYRLVEYIEKYINNDEFDATINLK
jgi:hypothetical protein